MAPSYRRCQNVINHLKLNLLNNVSQVSANTYLRHLKAAFATALRWEYIAMNPFESIRFELEPERIPELVIEEVLRAILSRADSEERRYILVSLYTGMRPFELMRLRYGDIVRGVIRLRGKRGRARFVPVSGKCARLMGRGRQDEHVFGRWITPSGVSHMFRRLANEEGYRNIRLYIYPPWDPNPMPG